MGVVAEDRTAFFQVDSVLREMDDVINNYVRLGLSAFSNDVRSWEDARDSYCAALTRQLITDRVEFIYGREERNHIYASVLQRLDRELVKPLQPATQPHAPPARYSDDWYLSVFAYLCNDKKGLDDAGKVRFFDSVLRDGYYYLDGGRRESLWNNGHCHTQDKIKQIVSYCTEHAAKDTHINYSGEHEGRARKYEEKLAIAKQRIAEHKQQKKNKSIWHRISNYLSSLW